MTKSYFSWIIIFIIINIVLLLKFMNFRTTPVVMVFLLLFYVLILILTIIKVPKKNKLFHLKNKIGLFLLIIIILGVILKVLLLNEPLPPTETEWEYKTNALNYIQGNITGTFGEHTQLITFFLIIGFGIFGITTKAVALTGLTIYILSALIIFFTSRDIFKSDLTGLFTVIIFSILPQTFQYYTSAEPEPVAALFLIFAVWMVWKAVESERFLIPAALAAALSMNAKAELVIFSIPFLGYYIWKTRKLNQNIFQAFLVYLFVSIPGYIFFFAQRGFRNIMNRFFPKYFTFYTEEFPLDYTIKDNIKSFFSNLLNGSRHPFILFILFLAGFINLKKYKQELTYIGLILFTYLFVYSLFVFRHQMRYIILIYPVLCLWFGHGLFNIYDLFKKNIKINKNIIIIILIIIVVLSSGILSEVKGKYFRLENNHIGFSMVKEFVDENTTIVCEDTVTCRFELFPNKVFSVATQSENLICINGLESDFCNKYKPLFEHSEIIHINYFYLTTKFY